MLGYCISCQFAIFEHSEWLCPKSPELILQWVRSPVICAYKTSEEICCFLLFQLNLLSLLVSLQITNTKMRRPLLHSTQMPVHQSWMQYEHHVAHKNQQWLKLMHPHQPQKICACNKSWNMQLTLSPSIDVCNILDLSIYLLTRYSVIFTCKSLAVAYPKEQELN